MKNTVSAKGRAPKKPRFRRGMQFSKIIERADSLRFCASILAELFEVPEWQTKDSFATRTFMRQGTAYKHARLINDRSGPAKPRTRAALTKALDTIL